jgi:hypothetical protein
LEDDEEIATLRLLGDGKGAVTTTTVVWYPPIDCWTGVDMEDSETTGFVAYVVL